MGKLQADEMIQHAGRERALAWHLSHNHYPPIAPEFIPLCVQAIDNAIAGEWDKLIELPKTILWRGESACPTHALVEYAHLESWIDAGDE